MKKVTFPLLAIIFCFSLLFSCGGSGDDPDLGGGCIEGWADKYSNALTSFGNTVNTYFDDPSPANCTTYKSAYNGYIDALEDFIGCSAFIGVNKTQWEATLQDARDEVSTLCD